MCGAFAADVCRAYTRLATTGVADEATLDLLRRRSPAPVLSGVRAPVLLMPGESDSLFPLSQADASARALASAGVPVRTVWLEGGHDGGLADPDRAETETLDWLDRWLPLPPERPTAAGSRCSGTGDGVRVVGAAPARRRRPGGPRRRRLSRARRAAGAARAPRTSLALSGPGHHDRVAHRAASLPP